MEKVISIDGKSVAFKATAGTIRQYRARFGRDLLMDFQKLQKEASTEQPLTANTLTVFENLAFTMAKQADPSIPDTPDEWLDSFEMFSIYTVLPELVTLWVASQAPVATQKKEQPQQTDL